MGQRIVALVFLLLLLCMCGTLASVFFQSTAPYTFDIWVTPIQTDFHVWVTVERLPECVWEYNMWWAQIRVHYTVLGGTGPYVGAESEVLIYDPNKHLGSAQTVTDSEGKTWLGQIFAKPTTCQ